MRKKFERVSPYEVPMCCGEMKIEVVMIFLPVYLVIHSFILLVTKYQGLCQLGSGPSMGTCRAGLDKVSALPTRRLTGKLGTG